jgi:hypothetical protein
LRWRLEIDAPSTGGSSGGPVLDAAGHVIGVVYAGGRGLTAAIPLEDLRESAGARGRCADPAGIDRRGAIPDWAAMSKPPPRVPCTGFPADQAATGVEAGCMCRAGIFGSTVSWPSIETCAASSCAPAACRPKRRSSSAAVSERLSGAPSLLSNGASVGRRGAIGGGVMGRQAPELLGEATDGMRGVRRRRIRAAGQ